MCLKVMTGVGVQLSIYEVVYDSHVHKYPSILHIYRAYSNGIEYVN